MKPKKTSQRRIATSAKTAKPKTRDDYLAALSDGKRAALETLRRAIKAAAPEAEECISYQLPAFRLNGKLLVAFGAAANHCAFYPGSSPWKPKRTSSRPTTPVKAPSAFTRTVP